MNLKLEEIDESGGLITIRGKGWKVVVYPILTNRLRTNEIKTAAPLLDSIDITGKTITADALLTQREFAEYLLMRESHYHFTVKGNRPTLLEDIKFHFTNRHVTARTKKR